MSWATLILSYLLSRQPKSGGARASDVGRADIPRSCKTTEPLAKPYYAKAYSHEEIGSFCLRDPLFGGEQGFERAEADWAQSEVGEGVEELWERSVSASDNCAAGL